MEKDISSEQIYSDLVSTLSQEPGLLNYLAISSALKNLNTMSDAEKFSFISTYASSDLNILYKLSQDEALRDCITNGCPAIFLKLTFPYTTGPEDKNVPPQSINIIRMFSEWFEEPVVAQCMRKNETLMNAIRVFVKNNYFKSEECFKACFGKKAFYQELKVDYIDLNKMYNHIVFFEYYMGWDMDSSFTKNGMFSDCPWFITGVKYTDCYSSSSLIQIATSNNQSVQEIFFEAVKGYSSLKNNFPTTTDQGISYDVAFDIITNISHKYYHKETKFMIESSDMDLLYDLFIHTHIKTIPVYHNAKFGRHDISSDFTLDFLQSLATIFDNENNERQLAFAKMSIKFLNSIGNTAINYEQENITPDAIESITNVIMTINNDPETTKLALDFAICLANCISNDDFFKDMTVTISRLLKSYADNHETFKSCFPDLFQGMVSKIKLMSIPDFEKHIKHIAQNLVKENEFDTALTILKCCSHNNSKELNDLSMKILKQQVNFLDGKTDEASQTKILALLTQLEELDPVEGQLMRARTIYSTDAENAYKIYQNMITNYPKYKDKVKCNIAEMLKLGKITFSLENNITKISFMNVLNLKPDSKKAIKRAISVYEWLVDNDSTEAKIMISSIEKLLAGIIVLDHKHTGTINLPLQMSAKTFKQFSNYYLQMTSGKKKKLNSKIISIINTRIQHDYSQQQQLTGESVESEKRKSDMIMEHIEAYECMITHWQPWATAMVETIEKILAGINPLDHSHTGKINLALQMSPQVFAQFANYYLQKASDEPLNSKIISIINTRIQHDYSKQQQLTMELFDNKEKNENPEVPSVGGDKQEKNETSETLDSGGYNRGSCFF